MKWNTPRLRLGIVLLAIALSICLALFGCAGPAPPPIPAQAPESTPTAEFEVSSLAVTPTDVVAGEPVTVKADVRNVGEVEGTYTVTMAVDGKVIETKDITMGVGATETVIFTYSTDAVGTYSLGVDGLSATLKVLEPAPSGPAEVSLTSNRAIADFPNTIAFALEGSSTLPVTNINLEYGTDKRSVVSEISRVEPEYAPGNLCDPTPDYYL